MSSQADDLSPGGFFRSKGRVAILVALAGALALQWWTWFQRYPLIAQKQAEKEQINKLDGEVLQMMLRWPQEEAAQVEFKLLQTYENLFSGNPNSGAWTDQVIQPGNAAALAITVRSEEPVFHPTQSDTIVLLPTQWDVKPKGAGPEDVPLLAELLGFLKEMTGRQPKRMDLVNLAVSGDGNTLTRAQFGFQLWFKKQDL